MDKNYEDKKYLSRKGSFYISRLLLSFFPTKRPFYALSNIEEKHLWSIRHTCLLSNDKQIKALLSMIKQLKE